MLRFSSFSTVTQTVDTATLSKTSSLRMRFFLFAMVGSGLVSLAFSGSATA
jgi:hypothetical protein